MFPFFECIVAFTTFIYFLETYLDYRQYKQYKIASLPKELSGIIEKEAFTKAQEYGLAKSKFGFFCSAFEFVHGLAILFLGAMPWLWDVSLQVMEMAGFGAEYAVTRSVVFMMLAEGYSTVLHVPFELYSTFVIEERFGFNKQTPLLFFTDLLKTLALGAAIGIPIISILLHLIDWGGEHFYIYAWVFLMVITVILMTIYPNFIAPLFNKFDPLPEGELRDSIYRLCDKLNFPLTKLYVVDGSKRSAHSNAYFYGFFKNKRIVLYDTLLQQVDHDGILAILGHELGHYFLNHVVWNLVISQVHILAFFFLFSRSIHSIDLYRSFGFSTEPTFIGLVLFSFIYGPAEHLFSFLMNMLSRHFEYQADAYAVDLGFSLSGPLTKIHVENSGNMVPDPWFSAYHFSHPTLIERLRAIETLEKAKGKKKE